MAKTKFKFILNRDGVSDLMKTKEMQAILAQYGDKKANQAGSGYDSQVYVLPNRAIVNIFPTDFESAHDNYENNTLLKVISG